MTYSNNYIYLRGLRQVDHTVFCVADGQKTYYDPITRQEMPYSSGQQVKRSIIDELTSILNVPHAPITFNFTLTTDKTGKRTFGNKEPWSPCDPHYIDQLIGGWMRATAGDTAIKRRSPLSISAMRPLHPTLTSLGSENITFDRSDHPEQHVLRVVDGDGKEIDKDDFFKALKDENRNAPLRLWIPAGKVGPRANGLFVYDIAIDLRTLFSIALNDSEPEVTADTLSKLKNRGWKENKTTKRLAAPKPERDAVISALAPALINWRITSNQSRTYSPQNTLAVAIGTNANSIGAAIRADLSEDSGYKRASPVVDIIDGTQVFTALTAQAYVPGAVGSATALTEAEKHLHGLLNAHDYDG